MKGLKKELFKNLQQQLVNLEKQVELLEKIDKAIDQQLTIPVVVPSVLCVKMPYDNSLTLGEKYATIKEHDLYFIVKNDLGKEVNYCRKIFKKL